MKHRPNFQLAIVSSRSVFSLKTQKFVSKEKLSSQVKFLGFVPDKKLVSLYHNATALVQPSQSEGFGLTGIEAFAAGLPVICSPNPVLKEVYRAAAQKQQNLSKPILGPN